MKTSIKRKSILVVDDEPEICQLLKNRLLQDGYDVAIANDGLTALKQVKASHPDLIILDLMLPGRDGIEVCRDLKNQPATKHIPIIMLTARATPTDEVLGLEMGADDYVTKPYEYRVLSTRIKKQLTAVESVPSRLEPRERPEVFVVGPLRL